jgi:hypothetical protein
VDRVAMISNLNPMAHAFVQLQPKVDKFAIEVDKLVTIVVPAGLIIVKK